jgi:hypothetical protein
VAGSNGVAGGIPPVLVSLSLILAPGRCRVKRTWVRRPAGASSLRSPTAGSSRGRD